jgi:hypothetical protein
VTILSNIAIPISKHVKNHPNNITHVLHLPEIA